MRRFQDNPILQPIASNPWESRRVFNAAAIGVGKQVHILYRAIGNDGISRIGYASSSDGYMIDERSPVPVFEPNNRAEDCGCEDPRLTLFDDQIVMSYTALSEIDHEQLYQISLTSISVDDFLSKQWKWNERVLPFRGVRNKNAVIFPQENRRQVRHVSSPRARHVRGVLRRPQKMVRHQVLDETKNEKLGLLESRRSRTPHRTQRGLAPYLPRRVSKRSIRLA